MVTNKLKVGDKGLMFIDGQPIAVDKIVDLLLKGERHSTPEVIEKYQLSIEHANILKELLRVRKQYWDCISKLQESCKKMGLDNTCYRIVGLHNLQLAPINSLLDESFENLKKTRKQYIESKYQITF